MKIKQIRNKSEQQLSPGNELSQYEISEKPPVQRKNYTLLIFGFISVALISAILLYVFVFNKDDGTKTQSSSYSDSLKLKELELKERELKLKESQLNNTSTADDAEHIKNIVQSLINEFNAKSTAVGRYYGSRVNYYAWGPTDKAKVINDKKAFFSRWDYLNMYIDNILVHKESDNIFKCDYDKTLESSNYTNGKNLKLKVKSVLLFEKINNEWLITEERDEQTYYLNKNY